ncbi:Putative hypothetical protein [Helicobacter mustelae 12198]|uniref:Uncharacterized protein n=1 Tax=Helicobacter mustelae (strain ATCC 43772 / CCUG 25715 / CIP 103759 / LMG 18044 / NCTC 12198 / R85-136P) TaxID=679897 RepID=D3UFT1_HELM1|nr:Putative hypothetical protein [Helicobacter mustelae 12198]
MLYPIELRTQLIVIWIQYLLKINGVDDGARTHDPQSHNLML